MSSWNYLAWIVFQTQMVSVQSLPQVKFRISLCLVFLKSCSSLLFLPLVLKKQIVSTHTSPQVKIEKNIVPWLHEIIWQFSFSSMDCSSILQIVTSGKNEAMACLPEIFCFFLFVFISVITSSKVEGSVMFCSHQILYLAIFLFFHEQVY